MTRPPPLPLPTRKNPMTIAVFVVPAVGLILLFLWAMVGTNRTPDYEMPTTASEFYDVRVLEETRERNAVVADEGSRGMTLPIKGRIASISSDIVGDPYVLLTGKRLRVQCFFPDKHDVVDLRQGQQVFIVGKCRGTVLGNMVFVDCRVAHPKSP